MQFIRAEFARLKREYVGNSEENSFKDKSFRLIRDTSLLIGSPNVKRNYYRHFDIESLANYTVGVN